MPSMSMPARSNIPPGAPKSFCMSITSTTVWAGSTASVSGLASTDSMSPMIRPRSRGVKQLGRSAAELLVQRHERNLEGLDRVGIHDDVVSELEHRQLVSRDRREGKPLRQRCLDAQHGDRDVNRWAVDAQHPLEPVPELVPGGSVRP